MFFSSKLFAQCLQQVRGTCTGRNGRWVTPLLSGSWKVSVELSSDPWRRGQRGFSETAGCTELRGKRCHARQPPDPQSRGDPGFALGFAAHQLRGACEQPEEKGRRRLLSSELSATKLPSFLCFVNLDLFSLCCISQLLIQRAARGIFPLVGVELSDTPAEEKLKTKRCPFLAVDSQHQVTAYATGVRTSLLPPPPLFAVFRYDRKDERYIVLSEQGKGGALQGGCCDWWPSFQGTWRYGSCSVARIGTIWGVLSLGNVWRSRNRSADFRPPLARFVVSVQPRDLPVSRLGTLSAVCAVWRGRWKVEDVRVLYWIWPLGPKSV